MELYEYLIGGKKRNIPDTKLYNSKDFNHIERGDHLILWNFDRHFNLTRKLGWKVEKIGQGRFGKEFPGSVQIIYCGNDDYISKKICPGVSNEDTNKNIHIWQSSTDSLCAISSIDDEEEVKKQIRIELKIK